ncbi:MAG TPA: rod shape-determining protein MreC [Candidatus Ventricola intestinavium]|nr:rod shape-determining protein MreC [Candidatus Ventricola intestinavium]
MKKKHPFLYSIVRRTIVLALIALMALTAYNQSSGQLFSPEGVFSRVITPVQSLVSQVTQAFSGYLYRIKLRSNIEYEYNQLKAQNDELVLRSLLYEELEEENAQLRALLGEYEERASMNPVLARVIASETGNYFSTFTINKGRNDGVDTQMAVITSEGLVGYTYEVFDTTSKVITIIDDQASLAALIESSRDQGAVNGTLGSTGEPLCRMYYLSADSVPRPGDRVITSGVGVSFPKGLLIGYVRESTRAIEDSKHYIVVEPAADFEHIENVLVLRYYAEVEEMPENYDNTEIIIAPVATARPQAVIEEERLNASTPVPLPDAPGRATPSPTPETVDFIIDEEAMGDLADSYVEASPSPGETPEPEQADGGLPEEP